MRKQLWPNLMLLYPYLRGWASASTWVCFVSHFLSMDTLWDRLRQLALFPMMTNRSFRQALSSIWKTPRMTSRNTNGSLRGSPVPTALATTLQIGDMLISWNSSVILNVSPSKDYYTDRTVLLRLPWFRLLPSALPILQQVPPSDTSSRLRFFTSVPFRLRSLPFKREELN